MTFKDVLITTGGYTSVQLSVHMYGLKFQATHYPGYYLDTEEAEDLLGREVMGLRVSEGTLVVELD